MLFTIPTGPGMNTIIDKVYKADPRGPRTWLDWTKYVYNSVDLSGWPITIPKLDICKVSRVFKFTYGLHR
jgi:hypothetical protein